jgi:hypothetical protein
VRNRLVCFAEVRPLGWRAMVVEGIAASAYMHINTEQILGPQIASLNNLGLCLYYSALFCFLPGVHTGDPFSMGLDALEVSISTSDTSSVTADTLDKRKVLIIV